MTCHWPTSSARPSATSTAATTPGSTSPPRRAISEGGERLGRPQALEMRLQALAGDQVEDVEVAGVAAQQQAVVDADAGEEDLARHVLGLLDVAPGGRVAGGDLAQRAQRLGGDVNGQPAQRLLGAGRESGQEDAAR